MYKTTSDQRNAQRGCHTCEANLTCQWVRGISKDDRVQYICRNYTNKGKDQNGQSHKARH